MCRLVAWKNPTATQGLAKLCIWTPTTCIDNGVVGGKWGSATDHWGVDGYRAFHMMESGHSDQKGKTGFFCNGVGVVVWRIMNWALWTGMVQPTQSGRLLEYPHFGETIQSTWGVVSKVPCDCEKLSHPGRMGKVTFSPFRFREAYSTGSRWKKKWVLYSEKNVSQMYRFASSPRTLYPTRSLRILLNSPDLQRSLATEKETPCGRLALSLRESPTHESPIKFELEFWVSQLAHFQAASVILARRILNPMMTCRHRSRVDTETNIFA